MTTKIQFVFDETIVNKINPPKIISMVETIGNLFAISCEVKAATCSLEEAHDFLKETDKFAGWNSDNSCTINMIRTICKMAANNLYEKIIGDPEECLATTIHWKICRLIRNAMKAYKFNVVATLHAKWGSRQGNKQLIYYYEGILTANSTLYEKHLLMNTATQMENEIAENNLVGNCYLQKE